MKNKLSLFTFILSVIVLTQCKPKKDTPQEMAQEPIAVTVVQNKLSEAEIEDGWKSLFNGEDISEWRNFNKTDINPKWRIEDGTLHYIGNDQSEEGWESKKGGDIITKGQYDNFEFKIEWKISPNGNSGIMYNVVEEGYEKPYHTGPEMQILDNDGHPDGKIIKHRAGDLYDLISCSEETVRPVGEWNEVMIRIKDGHLQHWLNGVKVVQTRMWTPAWDTMVANSKFVEWKDFGTKRKGHICLQDHDNEVWFRNIKIREI